MRHKLAVLAEYCAAIGRPYDDIDKTASTRFQPGDSPSELADRRAVLADLGIQHVVLIMTGPWTGDAIASVGTAAALGAQA